MLFSAIFSIILVFCVFILFLHIHFTVYCRFSTFDCCRDIKIQYKVFGAPSESADLRLLINLVQHLQ